ncbi:hypothetical protein IV203_021822 [Nitzschia inconspicua]|uniref:Ribosome maturation protein SDO1/SBDS N-terminal domain-containing protein n=1 Tax=Nitzschia inconspicua TaxID=303405 RepID=A0A9K3PGA1_9STRA|nr:hypothetical protein IV203_021822 [Nitzschia inconspicua]
MGKQQAHPKQHGIVPNKEGTGAITMAYKVEDTHFIIVLDDSAKSLIEEIQKHPDKVGDEQLGQVYSSLAIEEIYAEKVGEKASEQQLNSAFNSVDTKAIVNEIVLNGKFH